MRVLVMAAALVAISCSSDDSSNDRELTRSELLEQSLADWNSSKPDLYSYEIIRYYGTTEDAPDYEGMWQTMVTVENGKVSCRAFKQQGDITRTYKELGDDVGNHDYGWSPKTIAQIYDDCAKIVDSSNIESFSILDGILSSCYLSRTEEQKLDLRDGIDNMIQINHIYLNSDKCSDLSL